MRGRLPLHEDELDPLEQQASEPGPVNRANVAPGEGGGLLLPEDTLDLEVAGLRTWSLGWAEHGAGTKEWFRCMRTGKILWSCKTGNLVLVMVNCGAGAKHYVGTDC